jgi:5S rRNA maturation endonuclease (ribonuclease M5)
VEEDSPQEEYLKSRGMLSSWVSELGIRIFPSEFGPFPQGVGSRLAEVLRQVVSWREGSMVFPLRTPRGLLGGFEIRDLRKNITHHVFEVVSPIHPLWLGHSVEQMEVLWKTGILWVVEGVFDASALRHLLNQEGAVLAAGTAHLTEVQIEFVRRFAKKVYLAFDMDKAGRQGQEKAQRALGEFGVPTISVEWRGSKDFGHLWDMGGRARLREHLMAFV